MLQEIFTNLANKLIFVARNKLQILGKLMNVIKNYIKIEFFSSSISQKRKNGIKGMRNKRWKEIMGNFNAEKRCTEQIVCIIHMVYTYIDHVHMVRWV